MTCPNCGVDYSESKTNNSSNRIAIGPLPHYGQPFQLSGLICRNCGFVAEIIKKPTGNPFFKRADDSPRQDIAYTHNDVKNFLTQEKKYDDFKKYLSEKWITKKQEKK